MPNLNLRSEKTRVLTDHLKQYSTELQAIFSGHEVFLFQPLYAGTAWGSKLKIPSYQLFKKIFAGSFQDISEAGGPILGDSTLHKGYHEAARISVINSFQANREDHKRNLPPLNKATLNELDLEGRAVGSIGRALSLKSRFSFSSSTFDVRY